jgi:predicted alpha/beta hydrolase family esterase
MKSLMPSRTDFLVVHGTGGSPDGNWFPWLKQKLEAGGAKVFVPRFPTPEGQSFNAWLKIAQAALKNCAPANTMLVGHSTGGSFVLRLAELAPKPYKTIFSICPFVRALGLKDYDSLNSTFVHHAFDWARIKKNAGKIICFAGDNDPYVPLAYSRQVAEYAGAELIVIEKGGHLNAESGYREFPQLLEKIRQG